MKNTLQRIICCLAVMFSVYQAKAQPEGIIKGVVSDASTGQTIAGVALRVQGIEMGGTSDAYGAFSLNLAPGTYALKFTHVAYQDKELPITVKASEVINIGNILLDPRTIGLTEVHIISSYVSERGNPVAVSTVSAKNIEKQTGNQDYPEILKMVPGVYATKAGGGSGDDRLTIRGFQQENVALLLNGVPVSSMENGLVYWSNWGGLGDATEAIQVQRGLGASKVAMNSVGGTVNIITKSIQSVREGIIRYSFSNYGNQKSVIELSTGRLKNGYAITFLGSRTTGPGYVDGTYVNGWSYFLSVSKELGKSHTLVFTAMGSPEHHGQRNYGLTKQDIETYGLKYNPSWGVYNGEVLNLSENYYHKPQINLNHYWKMNPKMFLATSAYVSFGYGGGRYSESFNATPLWYLRSNNQIDFDKAILINETNEDSTQLSDGSWGKGYSKNILTNYRANHYWAGLLSTLNYSLSDKIRITSGLHVRTFQSRLYEEVDDLMGGDFWIEPYSWSLSGVAGRDQIKKVGDVINVDNYSLMKYGNLFGQIEYHSGSINSFLSSTVSMTGYQRRDPYNYVADPYSEKVQRGGFDVKTGISCRLTAHADFYANAGFYSREPYFKFVYVNYSNATARDLRNEKISAAETGFDYNNGRISARMNLYFTYWKDKSLLSWENIQLNDSSMTRSLIRGLNSIHKGLEFEAALLVLKNLNITGTASLGDWKWQNDVTASIYDDNQVLVDSTRIYTKGLYVGDAPQTQVGISVDYSFLEDFNLILNWVYYDRLYANFEPQNRTNPEDRKQSCRLPSYGIADLHIAYERPVFNHPATFQLSCQNLLDRQVITRGDDGADHSIESVSGFWSQGRTFNLSFKLKF